MIEEDMTGQSSSNPLALTPDNEAAANWARYMYGRTRGHNDSRFLQLPCGTVVASSQLIQPVLAA